MRIELKQAPDLRSSGGCCCGPNVETGETAAGDAVRRDGYVPIAAVGRVATAAGDIPAVAARMSIRDRLGALMVRLGLRRMSYALAPGLYCVGKPNDGSPILVSANYKFSFDKLRSKLEGADVWVLVLDTRGINVWCAAGKGTFGTDELVNRVALTGLAAAAGRGTIVLPQLSAPGVSASEAARRTGFKVVFGPVRAGDIKRFLADGLRADERMRTVRFDFADRLVLVPVELNGVVKISAAAVALLALPGLFGLDLLNWSLIYPFLGAMAAGCILVPLLLPLVPVRAFAWKGWLLGAAWAVFVNWKQGLIFGGTALGPAALAWFLLLPAISAFLAMNFTGASTYTSLSGVVREMKYAVPSIAATALAGLVLFIIGLVRG